MPASSRSSTISTLVTCGPAARVSTRRPSRNTRWRWPWPACGASPPSLAPIEWLAPIGRNLIGARVLILGGGGICTSLITLLEPFGCAVTVFRHHDEPIAGARVITERSQLDAALPDADVVVIALALTDQTRGIVDGTFLSRMAPHAWLVNVGRGGHIVTDDLVGALLDHRIGGAALDVTDPEPLPPGHRLWSIPNCIVTPHIANTPEMGLPLIAARVRENVARFVAGEPLVGLVDVALGY